MNANYVYVIKVLSESGVWYPNALIENSFDAVAVGRFYREELGYAVQLWHREENVSFLLDRKEVIINTDENPVIV